MNEKKASPHLPLTHALGWIVLSMLLINGISYACLKIYLRTKQSLPTRNEDKYVRSIVQTGPQKEALKTEYLAEILELCADRPLAVSAFKLEDAQQKLLSSPLISQAHLKWIKPNILYIDYTVRQPIAWLSDYENVAIDKDGFAFPFAPFFSPKNLPEIYLGLSAFGAHSEDPEKPVVQWNCSLRGKYLDIALEILSYVTNPTVSDGFNVTWIDVSRAFSKSCGMREIILVTQDELFEEKQNKEIKYILPRMLRLSRKNFAQELGNYLKLREQLLEEDRKKIAACTSELSPQKISEKIIDFRIPNLAFVEEKDPKPLSSGN